MFPVLVEERSGRWKWNKEKDAFVMAENGMTLQEKADKLDVTYGAIKTRKRRIIKGLV